jgi:hypothetical protein
MPGRVFVDTETTGVGPRAQLIEVGYVRDDGYELCFNLPYDKLLVEAGAHRVNDLGFGGRPAAGIALSEKEAVGEMVRAWRDRELYFNNPGYDMWLIRSLLTQYGADTSWRYHAWDVAALIKGAALARPNEKLLDVAAKLGLEWEPEPEVHNALDGARLVKRMFDAYVSLTGWKD